MTKGDKRKLGGRWCREISTSEVRAGDVIEFYRNGSRWRKVKSVTKACIWTEPVKYGKAVAAKSTSVARDEVVSAWTKRKEETTELAEAA